MVHLAGEFAGLVHVHVPPERAAELERALGKLEGLTVTVARVITDQPAPADLHFLQLEVVGHDRSGIVRRVTEVLAQRGVNVEELQSRVFSAPMSAEMLFEAKARLSAPRSVRLSDLQKDLEEIAADLMVEVEIAEGVS
jgi:glycine cleavage system regulatory protein